METDWNDDSGDTIFHKIMRKEVPADIIYEDDEIIALNDINPVAPVHFLVIPRKTLPSLREAEQEDTDLLGRMLLKAKEIAKQRGLAETGYRLAINAGPAGGQEVFQLHIHVIGGRTLNWPPG